MRRTRRRLAGLAVVAMLVHPVAEVLVLPAAPAEAAIGAVNLLFDANGDPPTYGRGRVVRIEAGNINLVQDCLDSAVGQGIKDWFQPVADLYVVGGGGRFIEGASLNDVAGAPNTVFGGFAGQFFDVLLTTTGSAAGRAGSGTYDVVVDECQNGVFDLGQDTVVRDAFRVDLDLDVPGYDTDLASFANMKQRARGQARDAAELKKMLFYAQMTEVANRSAKATIGIAGGLTGMFTFAVSELQNALDPTGPAKARGQAVANTMLNQKLLAAAHLAKDPPDPDFQTLAGPTRATGAVPPVAPTDLATATARTATAIDQLQAVETAVLAALERYQGAEQAGNPLWALRHARALEELATLHGELTAVVAGEIQSLHDAWVGNEQVFTVSNPFNQAMARGVFSDFTDVREFHNSGEDLADANAARDLWNDLVGTPNTAGHLANHLDAAVATIPDLEAWSIALATWAGEATAGVRPGLLGLVGGADADPTAVITPVPIAPGRTATLDGSASSAPAGSSITSWAWDLDGDGDYDDATGPTPSWDVPGSAIPGAPWLVGLQVATATGLDATHVALDVVVGGTPPEVVLAEPGLRQVASAASETFSIASITDADGDATTIEWIVDNQVVDGETGTSLDVTAPVHGAILVEVVVTDTTGAQTRDGWFLSSITNVDLDKDGYFASPGPDCDDDEWLVNPARSEIRDNGIDDDCDPSTSDDPSVARGNAHTPHPRSFYGQEGDEHAFTVTSWFDPDRYTGREFTMVVDWGDGTTSEHTTSGTRFADTYFTASHVYTDELEYAPLSYCIYTDTEQLVGCYESVRSIIVGNARPLVNAADLRTWIVEDERATDDPNRDGGPDNPERNDYVCPTYCGWLGPSMIPLDPVGRSVQGTLNPDYVPLRSSPVELAEGGYGRAMIEMAVDYVDVTNTDNDTIGFALGYQQGEIHDFQDDPTRARGESDYVTFAWRRSQGQNNAATRWVSCNDSPTFAPGTGPRQPMSGVWRSTGPSLYDERFIDRADAPYDPTDDAAEGEGPQHPGCDDDFGDVLLAELQSVLAPLPQTTATLGGWYERALAESAVLGSRPRDTYLWTIDYRPDRFRAWLDDDLVIDLEPQDPATPFPPGGVAVLHKSQSNARFSAARPEPGFTADQGTPITVTIPVHEPGSADELETLFAWGDGEPQTPGTATPDPTTGAGWFDVSADHAWARVGDYRGELCAADDESDSCFTFRVEVRNLPPVVDAGPDTVSGATFTLGTAQFTDPGRFDTHTATIDWGDGTTTAGVVDELEGAGTVGGSHTYAVDGSYTVEVCVTDQWDATGCDELVVEARAQNRAPVALLETTDGTAGEPIELGVGFTDENPDDTHTMTFDTGETAAFVDAGLRAAGLAKPVDVLGLGGFGQGTVVHTWTAPGTYDVRACVTDQDGASDCVDGVVTVAAVDGGTDDGGTDGGDPSDGGGSSGGGGSDDGDGGAVDPGDGGDGPDGEDPATGSDEPDEGAPSDGADPAVDGEADAAPDPDAQDPEDDVGAVADEDLAQTGADVLRIAGLALAILAVGLVAVGATFRRQPRRP